MTNPNCTAEVSMPTAVAGRPQASWRSGITALTANHSDVPANCDSTMTGRIRRGTAMLIDAAYKNPSEYMIPFSVLDLSPITEGSAAAAQVREKLAPRT